MKIEEKRMNEKEKDKKIMKSDDRFHEDNLRKVRFYERKSHGGCQNLFLYSITYST